ncbi:polysaccharide pyruvyl transferase family protein [Neobacillus sp. 19]|uniref:polysaccharide pyruvyl transferase family protein n=1 Tax=Neobacillus sp. 19 TaxID=3394458 RepID=UPI003BF6D104
MKKIMVYAYTHFNLGDDLFIKMLCERYPNVRFFLYAPGKYKNNFSNVKNIRIIPIESITFRAINYISRILKIGYLFSREAIAKTCDAAVYIGGSLFIQGENWESGIKNVKSMQIKNKPFFLLGVNFGPYKDMEYFNKYKELFQGYTDICFREQYSFELFNDLSNVRIADDIVFQLRKPDIKTIGKNIVISVIKPSVRKDLMDFDDIYYKKIKDISMYFIEKGYSITLMSFCELEGDEEAIESILKLIPSDYKNKINEYLYKYNIDETLDIIAASNFVIASRFHAMILGWVFNKPVFPIVYSSKMTNVMRDVGFNGLFTDFNTIEALQPEKVFECMKTNLIDVSNQVKNSEKHFEKLDEYLLN